MMPAFVKGKKPVFPKGKKRPKLAAPPKSAKRAKIAAIRSAEQKGGF